MKRAVIFGVGFHGRAAFRALRRDPEQWCITGFIDNAKKRQGTTFANLPIVAPSALASLAFDVVVMGGRAVHDMKRQLMDECRVSEAQIVILSRQELRPPSEVIARRSGSLEEMLGVVLPALADAGIPHWICASGLLGLMRGQDLAEMSDVDISVSQSDMAKTYDVLRKLADRFTIGVTHHAGSCMCWNKGDIHQISASSQTNLAMEEPAIVDFHATYLDYQFGYMDANGTYLRIPVSHFIGEDRVNYRGLHLPVPRDAEVYLALMYGDDWRTPAKQWAGHHRSVVVLPEVLHFR